MKKAKIVLTAIAVLAIVGGGLAVRAKTRTVNIFCTTQPGGICNDAKISFQITTNEEAPLVSRCTNVQGAGCGTTRITSNP